jgi:hypothetical protein
LFFRVLTSGSQLLQSLPVIEEAHEMTNVLV